MRLTKASIAPCPGGHEQPPDDQPLPPDAQPATTRFPLALWLAAVPLWLLAEYLWRQLLGAGLTPSPALPLIVALLAGGHFAWAWRTERDRARALRDAYARDHLASLTIRLSPHFLFNALHSVGVLAATDPDLAQRAIAELGQLLHTAIEGQRRRWTLERELEFVTRYLDLERLRHGQRLRAGINVAPGLGGAFVPTFVLQPVVENAVKHGVAAADGIHWVRIGVRAHGGRLELEVRNDLDAERVHPGPGAGFGLANLRRRLAALHGADARVAAGPQGAGAWNVRIELPFQVAVAGRADEAA